MLGAKALEKDRFQFRSRTLINLDTGWEASLWPGAPEAGG